jgi:glycosidase
VFARGRPTAELGHRIARMMQLHARPHLMATFVDNHDVDRFLAGGSEAGLKQALLALMTLPGIPVIYYGTEQGFKQPRAGAMFAAGYASGGRDRYDTAAPLYRYIADTVQLRRGHRLFSRGMPTVLKDNPAAAGALAWRTARGGRGSTGASRPASTPAA